MTDHVAAIERLGKYRILEEIRYGGIGLVYKAEDTLLKRIVALKVIAEQGDVTDELRSRFFKDAQACAKLSHPNMVTVYDAGEEQGRLFMVVEYVEGDELDHTISTRDDHALEERIGIMIQVCRGLAYAHQRGVLHRDVRPENVIVQRNGMIKLLDFGIARIAARNDATPVGSALGNTLRYAAPEQMRGQGDIRSDVFSAAALFYDLVASRGPERGTDALAVLESRDSSAASLYAHDAAIPRDLETVLERALRREPGERFRDMSQLQAELESVRRRLREEARAVHQRLEAGTPELARLRAQLAERIDGPAPGEVTLPDEQLPLSVLEAHRRQQVEEIERTRRLLERAESLRPEYAEAKSLAQKAEWTAAVAALERIVHAMPEHAGAAHALEEAQREARQRAPAPAGQDDAETVMIDRAKLGLVHSPPTDVASRVDTSLPDEGPTVKLDRSRLETAPAPATDLLPSRTSAPADMIARGAGGPTEIVPATASPPTELVSLTSGPTELVPPTASRPTDVVTTVTPTPLVPSTPSGPTDLIATDAPTPTTDVQAHPSAPAVGRPEDEASTVSSDRPAPARVSPATPTRVASAAPAQPPESMATPTRAGSTAPASRVSTATPARVGPAEPMPPARVFTRPTAPVAVDVPVRRRLTSQLSGRMLAVGAAVLVVVMLAVYWMHGASETARRLEQELTGARRQTEAARDGARRAGAEQLTPDLYAAAAAKEKEAADLARSRRAPEAIAALADATRRYNKAERGAWAAGKARDLADEARRRMLAEKARAVAGTPEMEQGLAREREGEGRYRERRFADAEGHFDAAGGLFAKAVTPVKPSEPSAPGPTSVTGPTSPPGPTGPPGGDTSPTRTVDSDIRELLRSYSRAFETKDLGLLQQIRPGLSPEEIERHRAVFAQTRRYRLALKVAAINVRGDDAEARGQREDAIVTASGETVQTSGSFTFRFKRVNDRWRIDSVR